MLPVYFPFTGVGRGWLDASSGFFKKITVYQVLAAEIPERMKAWQDEQRLDIRLPLGHHEKEISVILREYKTWAQHHQGGDISFFKTQGRHIPFFEDSSVAQIRKEIKDKGKAVTAAGKTKPPDLYPGVFLQMAQDLDEKNKEIAGGLKSQTAREHELMKALKGDELFKMPGDSGPGMRSEGQDVYMMPERMTAWAHIMLVDDLTSPMLITSHPAALENLVEQTIQGEPAIQFLQTLRAPAGDAGCVSRSQDDLAAFLQKVSVLAWDGVKEWPHFTCDCDSTGSSLSLSLYVIPGMTPHELFANYIKSDKSDAFGMKQEGNTINNTLVGVLEP